MKSKIFLFVSILLLNSCSPLVVKQVFKLYPPNQSPESVKVFLEDEEYPSGYEKIAGLKVGDSGTTTNCGWDQMMSVLKQETAKMGGDAVKITQHIPPGWSSCHQFIGIVLKKNKNEELVKLGADSVESYLSNIKIDTVGQVEPGKFKLRIYRPLNKFARMLNYDLYLGDRKLTRVYNGLDTTIVSDKTGINTIWARTERKIEIFVNFKAGNEYILNCGVQGGFFLGNPLFFLNKKQ